MDIQQATTVAINQSGAEKSPESTPEFFSPQYGLEIDEYIRREDRQPIYHLSRYHWAKGVLGLYSPEKILDIACGAGYGSFILASHLNQATVLGADYDVRGIEMARQTYGRENLSYRFGSMVTWECEHGGSTEPLGSYDAIVSFDTIEHLLHREIALIRITQNLSSKGVFLMSTPCGHQITQLEPEWEHHKIEYSYVDLQNLLKRFFGKVLLPEEGNLPNMEYWDNVVNKGKLRYLNLSNPVVCADPIKY